MRDCRNAYSNDNKQRTRTDVYPTTLVRPTCGVCGKPLWLGRSGKYASFCCINGRDRKHGCTFKGYKSVSIVENAILSHLESELLTDDRLEALVTRANEFLSQEATKPKRDVKPIKAEIRKTKSKMERLADAIEDGKTDVPSIVRRLEEHGEGIKRLKAQLRDVEVQNDVPPLIDADVVKNHLQDLRGLLRQDVAQAAPIIRQLTGPIVVHQVKTKGVKKATWIAKFEANLIPVVTELARSRNCPSTGTLEYLETRSWTNQESEGVWLGTPPTYERIAPESAEMANRGVSINTIASALNTSWMPSGLNATPADATKGFAVFQKGGCIKCHKIADQGQDFGPALSAIGTKFTSKQLFLAILKPSETISQGYEGVSVVTDAGTLHTGFVIAETKEALTLRIPGGLQKVIPKESIDFRKRSQVSLMPVGIDAVLLPRELVDLVGWLKTQQMVKPGK
jgi:putative heme-binding domain-containing protein